MRRPWRIVLIAGGLAAFYEVTLAGAACTKFLKEGGIQDWFFGLMGTIAALAVCFQALSGILANHVSRRRPVWMALMTASRLSWLGLLLTPFLFVQSPAVRGWWVVAVIFLHCSLRHTADPIWYSWMADLVPRDLLSRRWAERHRLSMIVQVAVSLLVAGAFVYVERAGAIVSGFIVLGVLAVLVGLVEVFLFSAVPEPPHERAERMSLAATIVEPFKDREFGPALVFMCYWKIAALLFVPFLQVFLLGHVLAGLATSVTVVQALLTIEMLGIVLSVKFWGLLCDVYGQRPVIQICAVGRLLLPLLLLVSPPVPGVAVPLLALGFLSNGLSNGGIGVAFQTLRMKISPRRNRAMYIGAVNLMSMGLATAVGSLIGTCMIKSFEEFSASFGIYTITGFHIVVATSVVLSLPAWFVAGRIREKGSLPGGTVLNRILRANPVRVVRLMYRMSDSPSETERADAARRLGEIGSPLAAGELLRAMRDEAQAVRQAAAEALGRIEPVAEMAEVSPDSDPAQRIG